MTSSNIVDWPDTLNRHNKSAPRVSTAASQAAAGSKSFRAIKKVSATTANKSNWFMRAMRNSAW